MKKIIKLTLSIVIVTLMLTSAFLAYAYEPYDSDFVKVWDVAGEIGVDEEGGAQLSFTADQQNLWAGRINYNETVEVDGLEIKLTNVKIDEGAAPVIMFGNELGEWCDSPTPFLMALYNVRSHETLGELEHGYFSVSKSCSKTDLIFEPVALENSLEGEITLKFKKDGDKWIFTVNGQAIELPGDSFDYLLDETSSFINFGNYTWEANNLTYTVKEVNQLGNEQPSETDPETPSDTTAAPSAGESTTKAPDAAGTTKTDEKDSSNDLVLYIILGAVLVVAVVVAVLIVVKSKKSKD